MVKPIVGQSDIFSNTPHALDPAQVRYFTGKPCRYGHIAERYVRNAQCVTCVIGRTIAWVKVNKERVFTNNKAWRIRNSEQVKALLKGWIAANPAKYAAGKKRWRNANPEIIRHCDRIKRAKRRGVLGSHSKAQVATLYILQKAKCGNCGTSLKAGYHVDHKMPIARGGTDDITNLECLCPSCNSRKHVKLPEVWARENGRLI